MSTLVSLVTQARGQTGLTTLPSSRVHPLPQALEEEEGQKTGLPPSPRRQRHLAFRAPAVGLSGPPGEETVFVIVFFPICFHANDIISGPRDAHSHKGCHHEHLSAPVNPKQDPGELCKLQPGDRRNPSIVTNLLSSVMSESRLKINMSYTRPWLVCFSDLTTFRHLSALDNLQPLNGPFGIVNVF